MRKYLVLTIVVLLALGGALAAGCGGDESPVGEYKWKSGEEAVGDMTIVLADDGTFTLNGVAAGTDVQQIIEGTWTQDGSQVTLTLGEGDEADSEPGEYKDGQLIFDDVVWEKQ
jgi:lipocalin-like protein